MAIAGADKENLEKTVDNLFGASCGEGGCSIRQPAPTSFSQQLKQKYSFRAVHNSIMSSIMNTIISWILSCFNKYDEPTFHKKMWGTMFFKDKKTGANYMLNGFDFIADWNKHHPYRYETILKIIRKTGTRIDRQKLYESVIQTIQKHGWTVYEQEKKCFILTVKRLYNILYHNIDSAAELD